MANDVRIAELETQAGGQQVHFELLGGCKGARSVSFRCSESLLEPSPEALLPCRLLPAMRRGCDLDLPDPLSPRLMAAVPTIVDILAAWFPKLQRVSVRGQSRAAMPRRASGRVGSFFSGGLDSFYTLLKHRDEITDLIFVHGFDVSPRATGVLRYIASDLEELGGDLGVNVLHVETNLRDAVLDCTDWGFGHGPALMAVGHMLAPSFERIYVPASCSYTGLFPWGSHPLLDPLWSSELLEFVHDGCEANRVEKADLIGGSEAALRHLRVCPKSPEGALNCGRCEKCIRTMINLEAAGKLGQCQAFDQPLEPSRVAGLRVIPKISAFYADNLEALRERGLRPDIQRAIERAIVRSAWLDRTDPWLELLSRARRRTERVVRRRVLRRRGS